MTRLAVVASLASVLLFAAPNVASAQSASPEGVAAFNSELKTIYDNLRPEILTFIDGEARRQLNGLEQNEKKTRLKVERVTGVELEIDPQPGLRSLQNNRVEVAIPLNDCWNIRLDADVKVEFRFLGRWRTMRFPISIRVKRIRVTAAGTLDVSDPTRPGIGNIEKPEIKFKIKLRSKKLFVGLLLRVLSPVAQIIAKRTLKKTLDDLLPKLQTLAIPGPIPGDGAAPLTDSGAATPFEQIVGNIDAKTRQDHLPHGTLMMMRMDQPATDSWETAFANGGPGNVGAPTPAGDGGDSAFFTGHYLASQSFRYAVTRDSAALESVRHTLSGIEALLAVNDFRGLLARNAAPLNSVVGQAMQHAYGRTTFRGEEWVGIQGTHGISRDQYLGVAFGLMIAHDLVDDRAVKADCASYFQIMVDYLIANDWYIDEDRPAFDPAQGGASGFPTFYMGNPYQKLHYLLFAARLTPGKYAHQVQRWAPLADLGWLNAWTGTFNLDDYFKFNLAHVTYYNYFRIETDAARWRKMARGAEIIRRYVGHHHNPHFNLIEATINPALRPTYHPGVREGIRRFLTRNHRRISPPVVDLSGVTWVTHSFAALNLGGVTVPPTLTIPSAPLDIPLRHHTGDFMWQRGPFHPATAGQGDAHLEKPGIDILLPYWMGRYHGAF